VAKAHGHFWVCKSAAKVEMRAVSTPTGGLKSTTLSSSIRRFTEKRSYVLLQYALRLAQRVRSLSSVSPSHVQILHFIQQFTWHWIASMEQAARPTILIETFLFRERAHANDRWWLEGSLGTMSVCLAHSRASWSALARLAHAGYDHHAEVFVKVGWVCEFSRSPPAGAATAADDATYIEHATTWAYLCCCMSNAHLVPIRHL
jgi:pimeloyl-ACP methyl ester carboxylesterase